MLKIFHMPRTRSLRIVWLCEEMGVPYEVASEAFGKASPDFLAANPLGAFPAVTDGDVCMIESVAIMLYVMGTYGPTELDVKAGDPAYAQYLQFLMFGEAGMAMYGNPLIATKFMAPEDQRANWTVGYLRSALAKRLELVEGVLSKSEFIAGNRFTAADICVSYTLGMVSFATDLELSPTLKAYHERLTARPAFQRAVAVK